MISNNDEHRQVFNEKARNEFFRLAQNNKINLDECQKATVNSFFDTENHLSATELLALASTNCEECVIHDVEATITLLVEYGFAKKRVFENRENEALYEHWHLSEHHDHLVCIKCGKIVEFYDPQLESLQENISRIHGFETLNHRLEIYGICSDCLGKREPLMPISMAAQGEKVLIREIRGGRNLAKKLSDMGLTPDTRAEIITSGGQLIISVRGSRVAVGRGMASKILVSLDRND